MQKIRLISWNLNGIRAVAKKGLWRWIREDQSDIYCFQETKAKAEQVPLNLEMPTDFYTYWNSAERAGYSGVATYTRIKPRGIINGMGNGYLDNEGRVITTKFEDFTLLNVYFPNGKKDVSRLNYKMEFYDYFLKYINGLRDQGEKIVFCGDVNTAHQEIDLAHPKENENVSGFLKKEREWIDKVVENGYIDTFRMFHPDETNQYSWWSQRTAARKRNIGWRIDYFFVSEDLQNRVKDAFILPDVTGSDHCPIGIELETESK